MGVDRDSGPACIGVGASPGRRDLRQAEVEHLRDAAPGEENVGGLDVAMRDAFGMRGLERLGDLDPEPHQFVDRQRAARQSGA